MLYLFQNTSMVNWLNQDHFAFDNSVSCLTLHSNKHPKSWLCIFITSQTSLQRIYTQCFSGCRGTSSSKQVWYLVFKILQWDSRPKRFVATFLMFKSKLLILRSYNHMRENSKLCVKVSLPLLNTSFQLVNHWQYKQIANMFWQRFSKSINFFFPNRIQEILNFINTTNICYTHCYI